MNIPPGSGPEARIPRVTTSLHPKVFYSVPTSFFVMDARIPGIVRELITEAEGCLKMDFLTGASSCARKAIYELLVIERAEGADYETRIKSLKPKYPLMERSGRPLNLEMPRVGHNGRLFSLLGFATRLRRSWRHASMGLRRGDLSCLSNSPKRTMSEVLQRPTWRLMSHAKSSPKPPGRLSHADSSVPGCGIARGITGPIGINGQPRAGAESPKNLTTSEHCFRRANSRLRWD